MPVAQLNTRIDDAIKRSGDSVLRREGVSVAQAVRGLWGYMGATQTIPDFILHDFEADDRAELERRAERVVSGCGQAVRLAREAGLDVRQESIDALSYDDMVGAMYDDMLANYGLGGGASR